MLKVTLFLPICSVVYRGGGVKTATGGNKRKNDEKDRKRGRGRERERKGEKEGDKGIEEERK